jgi:hypothetical protein
MSPPVQWLPRRFCFTFAPSSSSLRPFWHFSVALSCRWWTCSPFIYHNIHQTMRDVHAHVSQTRDGPLAWFHGCHETFATHLSEAQFGPIFYPMMIRSMIITCHAFHQNIKFIHGPSIQLWTMWIWHFHGSHVPIDLLYLRQYLTCKANHSSSHKFITYHLFFFLWGTTTCLA